MQDSEADEDLLDREQLVTTTVEKLPCEKDSQPASWIHQNTCSIACLSCILRIRIAPNLHVPDVVNRSHTCSIRWQKTECNLESPLLV